MAETQGKSNLQHIFVEELKKKTSYNIDFGLDELEEQPFDN